MLHIVCSERFSPPTSLGICCSFCGSIVSFCWDSSWSFVFTSSVTLLTVFIIQSIFLICWLATSICLLISDFLFSSVVFSNSLFRLSIWLYNSVTCDSYFSTSLLSTFASCICAATIAENNFCLSVLLTHGANSSTAFDHSLNASFSSWCCFISTAEFHHHNTNHTIDEITNVLSLLAHVGISLSEPKNHATCAVISSCITSSSHSDSHHLTILLRIVEIGLVRVLLTVFIHGLVTALSHGINHQIKSEAYSTKPTVVHTHKDNKCTWLSVSHCVNDWSLA